MSDEERMLFVFGAFITYAMLKAPLLDNFDNTSEQNNGRKQIVDSMFPWVHGIIQPDRIFWELCKHAFNNPSASSDYDILNFYAMKSSSVHNQRLIEAFHSLYPNIFNELEESRKICQEKLKNRKKEHQKENRRELHLHLLNLIRKLQDARM